MTRPLDSDELAAKLSDEIDRLCGTMQEELANGVSRETAVAFLTDQLTRRNPAPDTLYLLIANLIMELVHVNQVLVVSADDW